jgi:hypothetical protein
MNRFATSTIAAAVFTLTLGLAAPGAQAPAGNKGPNEADEKGKDTSGGTVSRLNEAISLVSYARENESPMAMLTAVQMLRGVRAQNAPERVGTKATEAGAAGAAGKKDQAPPPSMDPKVLLNEAKAWAKGDAHVIALIDAELARPAAQGGTTLGVTTGAIRHVDRVNARTTDIYKIRFNGGEIAQVGIIGDGDTDLDLFVIDEFGNEVGRDDDRTDKCIVQWTPKWTGVFTVRIRNLGGVYNQYTLLTN